MSLPEKKSLLEEASNCIRLHQGGEADIYLVCLKNGERLILKWYRQSFNTALVDNAAKVRDEGICRIRECGNFQGSPFQLYDFVEGASSESLGTLPTAIALKALRQVVSSLMKALKVGVSHGDLNPANVIFTAKENSCFQTVLIDWGIEGPGALAFAAPERFQGKQPDEKSDIFSLGMLLYRWLTGENLVQAKNFDEFAVENSNLTPATLSEKLFLSGRFSAEEISALEPLWKGTLQNSLDCRAEDLEELDELLEIALAQVSGGEIALFRMAKTFAENLCPIIQKMGEKFSLDLQNPEKTVYPFKINTPKKCKNRLKIAILMGVGIAAAVIVFLVAIGTESPGVDDTGKMMLENSRSRDMDLMETSPSEDIEQKELPVDQLLNDLPTPSKE